MNTASRDRRNGFYCAAVVLVAIALTRPFAESGVNDDWSYTKTALDLAQSGHLRYNGWAAAMIGAQAYWGAAFIKIFGFSFLATRLSTVPLAAGCALLLYALHRRAQLPPHLSIFGTLTITLSPLFIPHAASFMTEVPGLFLLLASVYSYTRTAEMLESEESPPEKQRPFVLWLLAATGLGLLAGTVRQAFWILPVLAPLGLILRRQKGMRGGVFSILLVSSSLISLLVAVWLIGWFYRQPYAIHERVAVAFSSFANPQTTSYLIRQLSNIWITLGAVTLPVVVALSVSYVKISKQYRAPIAFGIVCVSLGLFLTAARLLFDSHPWIFPWLPNTFTITPYLTGPIPATEVRVVLWWPFWKGFSGTTMFLSFAAASTAIVAWAWPGGTKFHPLKAFQGMPPSTALLSLFTLAYLPLLLLKSLVPNGAGLFDRYLLPVLPLATIIGLTVYRRFHKQNSLPLVGWAVLVLMAYYGVAQTHDYFSALRARLRLTTALEAHGVPRTAIMGGFEYDSWTQITLAGHYNDPRIEYPPTEYIPPAPLSFQTQYVFWQSTPIVRANYIVCLAEHPDLVNSDLSPAKYSAWLPPFHRSCLVQVKDPQLASVRSLPLVNEGKTDR